MEVSLRLLETSRWLDKTLKHMTTLAIGWEPCLELSPKLQLYFCVPYLFR